MLKALLITRLKAMFFYLFQGSKRKNKSKPVTILFIALMVYAFACIIFMFGILFNSVCKVLVGSGLEWFYFSLAGILGFVFAFVGSIFTVQTQLYEAKDNELLLSMPILPEFILFSRMLMLYFMNLFFELMIAVPAGLVYCIYFTPSVSGVIIYIVLLLLLPFLSLSLSCLVGFVIALIASRLRNKTFVTLFFSLLFLAAYFFLYSKAGEYVNKLIENGEQIALAVKKAVFPAYHFGNAVAAGDILSLLIFALVSLAPFAVVCFVLSKSFITIATTKKGAAKVKYKEKSLKVNSQMTSLIKKELKHFVSSPMYMLNGALGVVFAIVAAVAIVIKRDMLLSIFEQAGDISQYIGAAAIIVLCMLASTNIVSAPSISLEGKNLWIAQSFPIDGSVVLMSKVMTHIVVCLPSTFIASVVFAFVLDVQPLYMLLLIIIPSLMTVFQALFGVAVNLKFPKFDWISETVAVKQGASTLITMLGSMGIIGAPIILYATLLHRFLGADIYISICAVLLLAACILLYAFLKNKGKYIFANLG